MFTPGEAEHSRLDRVHATENKTSSDVGALIGFANYGFAAASLVVADEDHEGTTVSVEYIFRDVAESDCG